MTAVIVIICLMGIAADILFIKSEYDENMKIAVWLKGIASAFFVILGVYCFAKNPSSAGKLIVIGLALGMIGDVLLNLRYLVSRSASNKVFALGILAFLSGHILYIVALFGRGADPLTALVLTAVISVLGIPPLMKRITAPSKGLKIFGYVYLVLVIAMFSAAASLLIRNGASPFNIVFALGALLFMVSDFIMIYYSFGKKIPPLRAINLSTYYIGQLLIACCVLFA